MQPLSFTVAKINKRLHIVFGGVSVYTPPNFVRVNSRQDMVALAEEFNRVGYRCIDAIMEFETKFSRK